MRGSFKASWLHEKSRLYKIDLDALIDTHTTFPVRRNKTRHKNIFMYKAVGAETVEMMYFV
jgi:hypothetical protein